MAILNVNTTAASAVNPATIAQTLHSYAVPANSYDYILVITTIKMTTTGTSQAQTLTLNLTIGASTKAFTIATAAAVDQEIFTLVHAAPARDAGTITSAVAAAGAADAQTALTSYNMIVIGENKEKP